MIEFSPSGELASITVPMDGKCLMQFQAVCMNELIMAPEEVVRILINQVLSQAEQKRGARMASRIVEQKRSDA